MKGVRAMVNGDGNGKSIRTTIAIIGVAVTLFAYVIAAALSTGALKKSVDTVCTTVANIEPRVHTVETVQARMSGEVMAELRNILKGMDEIKSDIRRFHGP